MKTTRKFRSGIFLGFCALGVGCWLLSTREPAFDGKSLTAWLDDLASQDEEEQALAAQAIHSMGSRALPHLLGNLSWLESSWRLTAIEWSRRQSWIKVNFDQRLRRVETGLRALSHLGPAAASAVPRVVALFAENDYAAASILASLGPCLREQPDAIRAVPWLIRGLSRDADFRSAATRALIAMGPGAAPDLIRALGSSDELTRERAVAILVKVAEPKITVPAILPLLRDRESRVRCSAASCLAEIAESTTAMPALLPLLEDQDPDVRRTAAAAIASFPRGTSAAIYELIRLLDDTNDEVRISAAAALAKIDSRQTVALQLLVDALKSPSHRAAAAEALGQLGRGAAETLPALIDLFKDSQVRARKLEAERSSAAKERRDSIDREQWAESHLRATVARAVGRIAPDSSAVVSVLIAALADNKRVQIAALETLGATKELSDAIVPALVAAAEDRDSDVRKEAVAAMAKKALSGDAVIDALIRRLGDDDKEVRCSAAKSLGDLRTVDDRILKALAKSLADSKHEVRIAATKSLAKLGAKARSAVPNLQRVAGDKFSAVREAAVIALNEIQR